MKTMLSPEGWPRPKGYANGIITSARNTIYIGGQIGWNAQLEFESTDFVAQTSQALLNVKAILKEAGAGPEHMVRMTWYITDRSAYLENQAEIGKVYREIMGKNYPTMSVLEVVALVEEQARVEIEVTAAI
ncbi:MAG: RidA family protein [Pseudomonadales bacterium]|nr:RidA family protein [Pseudomonadales bacterium]